MPQGAYYCLAIYAFVVYLWSAVRLVVKVKLCAEHVTFCFCGICYYSVMTASHFGEVVVRIMPDQLTLLLAMRCYLN